MLKEFISIILSFQQIDKKSNENYIQTNESVYMYVKAAKVNNTVIVMTSFPLKPTHHLNQRHQQKDDRCRLNY